MAYAILAENRDTEGLAELDAILEGKRSPKQAAAQKQLMAMMGRGGKQPPGPPGSRRLSVVGEKPTR